MRHGRARRLLAALPDGTLPSALEARVRDHADACDRCSRELRDLLRAEALLRRMPLSVAPLMPDPAAHARLARLARWTEAPEPARPGLWRVPALGVTWVVLAGVLLASLGTWSPVVADSRPLEVARMPEDSSSIPACWSPGQ